MKNISKTVKNWIYVCGITVLAICLCCTFTACTKAQAESADTPTVSILDLAESVVGFENVADDTEAAAENYSRWLSDHYSAKVFTCEQWMKDLLVELHLCKEEDDTAAVMSAAFENGIINSDFLESYTALTRRYVAHTMVRALAYEAHETDGLTDLNPDDTDMSTMVYFGYFIPDDNGKVYPDTQITVEEYKDLLNEVRRYCTHKGKLILSFGDSIMYGLGNNDNGIADMIAEKYGMSVMDFSISGATFGICADQSHIADQIETAAAAQIDPDIILIDGGTNDVKMTSRGSMSAGKQLADFNESTFAGGFEYAAYLLTKNWKNVPVVYVRAHDMGRRDDDVEQDFGELALRIADKWGFASVDIYNDTDFCTELDSQRDAYTLYKDKLGYSDGVHPTALGYAKYYLPLVADKICQVL